MKSAGLKTGAGRSLLGALMGFGFCSQKDPKIPKSTNGGDGISSGAENNQKTNKSNLLAIRSVF